MKTWHIIGSHGYIASRLLARRLVGGARMLCYSREGSADTAPLDLSNLSDKNFEAIHEDDYVVLLAAVSSPDYCRDHYEEVYGINVTGTKRLISECVSRKANVLFFSSDVVLGATEQAADETIEANPFGHYGRMKHIIEQAFAGERRVKVFRLSYVFSRNDKFMTYLEGCAANGRTADVFDALYRNVVYIEDVVDAICALADTFEQWENSIFHICGRDLLSRKDLAEIYQTRVNPDIQIVASIPDEAFFEARPNVIHTSSLYCEKLLRRRPMSISEAMKLEYLKNNR